MAKATSEKIISPFFDVYQSLLEHHGPQNWWPGDTPFEVMIGAILTQNTAWSNVEKAISNLNQADALAPDRLLSMGENSITDLIRPSGYFNVKARRLINFCSWYQESGGYKDLCTWETADLRSGLLNVNGIGPETADDILLYAFERSVFVIDAYTRRLFSRLELISADQDYERLRSVFESELQSDTSLFNEYHALIVNHAKDFCKTRPACDDCCLIDRCPYGIKKEIITNV